MLSDGVEGFYYWAQDVEQYNEQLDAIEKKREARVLPPIKKFIKR